jgi:hypothetical protein
VGIFKPSIAKIISIPAIIVASIIVFSSIATPPLPYINFYILLGIFSLLAYILSCIIWSFGKRNRLVLIVAFTILNILAAYFIIFIFFACVLPPCQPLIGPCQTSPCLNGNTFTLLNVIVTILILIIGSSLFLKEAKSKTKKAKK